MKTLKTVFFPVFLSAALILGMVSCTSVPSEEPSQPQVKTVPAKAAAKVAPAKAAIVQEPTDTEGILRRVAELCAKSDYKGALSMFDRIKAEDAGKDNVRLLKASVYLSAAQPDPAKEIAGEVSLASPQNTRALLVLAQVEQFKGNVKEQKAILNNVLKIEPNNVEALITLGNVAAAENTFRPAAAYYDRALAAEPDNGEALVGRAWVYRNNRDPKGAEKLLNKAISLYPNWVTPIHERGRLYKGAGFARNALIDLDKAKSMAPNDYWIACDRGDVLIDLSRKDEALAEYERAKKINPNYFLAYVYSAGLKDDLGDYDGAEKDYATLVKLNPDYYFGFEGLGMHLMRKGNWSRAKDAFLEAYNRAEQDTISYGLLASLNWMRGGNLAAPKQFLELVLKKAERDSLEWYMLRLYHDLVGDNDIVIRLDKEKNTDTKARMLYYLASYYDIRGNKGLADKYYLAVRDMDRKGMAEWRLNEWALEARGLALK
jgi:tetratricopeptide (TPR) repeat protein